MLSKVKAAIPVTVNDFDAELNGLIDAARLDLKRVGVTGVEDALVERAIITYVKAYFQSPADYDKLVASYEAQRVALSMATNYTDYEEE